MNRGLLTTVIARITGLLRQKPEFEPEIEYVPSDNARPEAEDYGAWVDATELCEVGEDGETIEVEQFYWESWMQGMKPTRVMKAGEDHAWDPHLEEPDVLADRNMFGTMEKWTTPEPRPKECRHRFQIDKGRRTGRKRCTICDLVTDI